MSRTRENLSNLTVSFHYCCVLDYAEIPVYTLRSFSVYFSAAFFPSSEIQVELFPVLGELAQIINRKQEPVLTNVC